MDPRNFHVGIKGLVFNDQSQLMLIEEEDGRWDLPGGRIEQGEQILQALAREVQEEMGVEVTVLDQHPYWAWTEHMQKTNQWMVRLGYRVSLSSFDFITTEECISYRFFGAQDIKSISHKLLDQNIVRLLQTHSNK